MFHVSNQHFPLEVQTVPLTLPIQMPGYVKMALLFR